MRTLEVLALVAFGRPGHLDRASLPTPAHVADGLTVLAGRPNHEQIAYLLEEVVRERKFNFARHVTTGACAMMGGALIVAGGADHLVSPIYRMPAKVVPWWPYPWAGIVFVGGALILLSLARNSSWGIMAGSFLVGGWAWTWAAMQWFALAFPAPQDTKISWFASCFSVLIASTAVLNGRRAYQARHEARTLHAR